MIEVALKAMRSIAYNNVGTIEFLLDEQGRYYFMEMNTRIQVEHPVTEQVYGLDLVAGAESGWPRASRSGGRRSRSSPHGHSIECRVNAEDPVTFAPSPGKITGYHQPGGYGVRVDTMAYEQYKVQPYYDSLVAKLVVTGANREIALKRMQRALAEYVIEGIKTNIAFHKRVMQNAAFIAGKYDTRIVDQILNPPATRRGAREGVDSPSPGPSIPGSEKRP